MSGTATVGQTLSCTTGTWTGDATIVFTYQWQRAGVNIGSATSSTYLLVDADYGSAIRCRVTGTNGAGNATANSNATAAVIRTYAQEVLADSPVGYWRLNETSGTAGASQVNAGTMAGLYINTPTLNVAGATSDSDKAITVSRASAQGMDVAATALLQVNDTYTYEAWIKLAATGSGTYKAICGRGSNIIDWGVWTADKLVLFAGGGQAGISTTAIPDTNWHHIAVTKNGGNTTKFYLDGVDVSGTTGNFVTDASTLKLAWGIDYQGAQGFDGSMDEVAFYATALSGARIAAHFAAR